MKFILSFFIALTFSFQAFAVPSDEVISKSVQDRMSTANLHANKDYYSKLSIQDKKLLLQLLFLEYSKRKDQSNQDRLNFTKVLAEVADITTTNLVENSVFELQLPEFKFNPSDNIIKNYESNYLSLMPSATYLLDFKNMKITLSGNYPANEYESVDNYALIAFDSIRNFAVLHFPELNSNEIIQNSKISFEVLSDRLLNTNPNFNVSKYNYE